MRSGLRYSGFLCSVLLLLPLLCAQAARHSVSKAAAQGDAPSVSHPKGADEFLDPEAVTEDEWPTESEDEALDPDMVEEDEWPLESDEPPTNGPLDTATTPSSAADGVVAPPLAVRLVSRSQEGALASALLGAWTSRVGKRDIALRFDDNGTFHLDGRAGTFASAGRTLTLLWAEGNVTYDFDVAATDPLSPLVLTLSGGDLGQPLKFSAQRTSKSPRAYMREVLGISPENVRLKAQRLLAVVLIVVVSRFIIWCLRGLSHLAIYSRRGPLKYIYRSRKNRTMTIHSLVLNIVKYVVYFGALGRILNELGVNYTAYFASLSVVGLAIGFGSQGLVQDIVTGFFVIFEGQFDVTDMVEISGQTGIVEELGLRMTRVRNYLGQSVTIPNRNIALVGTYAKGFMAVRVDVAIAGREAAAKAKALLTTLVGQLGEQYRGVVLAPPVVTGPLCLETGEFFVCVKTGIWPQQQWVIDLHLIPRLRELFKREGLEIPGDRVSACYHMPMEQAVGPRSAARGRRADPAGKAAPRPGGRAPRDVAGTAAPTPQ